MKRLLLVLILCPFLLFATDYNSNMLGQKLDGPVGDYCLKVEDSQESLYLNGILVFTRTTDLTDQGFSITTRYPDEREQIKTYDKDNKLLKIQEPDFTLTFVYSGTKLISSIKTQGSETTQVLCYYSQDTGRLIAIKSLVPDTSWTILSDDFVYSQQYLITNPTEGFYLTQAVEKDQKVEKVQENYVFSTDKLRQTYDSSGLLIKTEALNNGTVVSSTTYGYDSSMNLVSQELIEGDRKVVSFFKDLVLDKEETYIHGVLSKVTQYKEAIYVDLYEDGLPYAQVKYALDGRRVINILYY